MISRRVVLTGMARMPAIAAASPVTAIHAIGARLAAIPAGPALLASYITMAGGSDFDLTNGNTAYTYDNAVAGLALLASGDKAGAARIGDAFAIAQAHDPDITDGRLRNAYRAGSMVQPAALPGWWGKAQNRWLEDPYQVGSESGPIAWAMLLWAALAAKCVNAARYRAAANRAGDWIVRNLHAPNGFYGGYFGFPPHPRKLLWVSTEQNTDLAVAFARLGRQAEANHAASFVRSMVDGKTGLTDAGLTPGGQRNGLIAADANLWPYLAGLTPLRERAVIAALGWPRWNPDGIGFSSASEGIWLEGTAFAALALRRAHQLDPAQRFAATITANFAASGYVYATVPARLNTGLTIGPEADAPKFRYFRRPALAPTAWAGLLSEAANPLG